MTTTLKSIIVSSLCLFGSQYVSAQPTSAPKVRSVSIEYVRPNCAEHTFFVTGNKDWNQIEVDENETIYINLESGEVTQIAKVGKPQCIATKSEIKNDNLVLVSDKDEKVGVWNAKRYRVKNSNTELLITDNLGYSANPCPEFGAIDGAVLRVIKDGEITLEAKKINREIHEFDLAPACKNYREVSPSTYRSMVINSIVK